MSSLPNPRFTPSEYLDRERLADHKSEYHGGQIFAMAGASEEHNIITLNVGREISLQLRGRPCRTYVSDMRVKVNATGLYTYPDVVALCGDRQFDDTIKDTLVNPNIIVEVLSPSTELYDRGEKFAHYRRLETLTDYILIAQDQHRVEHYTRQDNQQWLLTEWTDLSDTIKLASIGCELLLANIYENIDVTITDGTVQNAESQTKRIAKR